MMFAANGLSIRTPASRRPVTFRHVIEYCDGWMPIYGRRDVLGAIAEFRQAVEDAGRDPASVELGVLGVPDDPAVLDAYREAGVARCLLGLPWAPADTVLLVLDGYVSLIDRIA